MNTCVVELGAATLLTNDYYGNYWWDAPVYDFKKRQHFE
jgi:hypothetical protein